MDTTKKTGSLYLIATPIGNLQDITHRALSILKQLPYIAVESSKHSSKLLNHFGISTKLITYNDHNESNQAGYIIELLKKGNDVGLISDAGTPLICDPGYRIVNIARQQSLEIIAIPGACALITALCVSGLPTDRFEFLGFLPAQTIARKKRLAEMSSYKHTWIVYESVHRIIDSLDDMATVLSADRYIVIGRELTKSFETIMAGSIIQLKQQLLTAPQQQKGEFVIIVNGNNNDKTIDATTRKLLELLLRELPTTKAASILAKTTGISKKIIYDYALQLKDSK